jgi:hypothetical protein
MAKRLKTHVFYLHTHRFRRWDAVFLRTASFFVHDNQAKGFAATQIMTVLIQFGFC